MYLSFESYLVLANTTHSSRTPESAGAGDDVVTRVEDEVRYTCIVVYIELGEDLQSTWAGTPRHQLTTRIIGKEDVRGAEIILAAR